MKTNVSGLNDAKFQVKTRLQSMQCIFPFAEMEFPFIYWSRHLKHGFGRYLTPRSTKNNPRGHEYQTIPHRKRKQDYYMGDNSYNMFWYIIELSFVVYYKYVANITGTDMISNTSAFEHLCLIPWKLVDHSN
jgi:hypothetical protein